MSRAEDGGRQTVLGVVRELDRLVAHRARMSARRGRTIPRGRAPSRVSRDRGRRPASARRCARRRREASRPSRPHPRSGRRPFDVAALDHRAERASARCADRRAGSVAALSRSFAANSSATASIDDDALGRHADLPLVHEGAERGGLHRLVEVGVVEHDERRLAAELEQHRLQVLAPARSAMILPTAVEPVKLMRLTAGCVDQRLDDRSPRPSASLVMTLTTPSAKPPRASASPIRRCVRGQISDALRMTVLPHASGMATARTPRMTGAFHGAMPRTTPTGWRIAMASSPACPRE